MNAPETCPGCDDEDHSVARSGFTEYACGTRIRPSDQFVHPSYQCLANQRDSLAARVATLESTLASNHGGEPLALLNELDQAREENRLLREQVEALKAAQ